MIYAVGMFTVMAVVCMYAYNHGYFKGEAAGYDLAMHDISKRIPLTHKQTEESPRIACVPEPGDHREPYHLAIGEMCSCPPGHHDPK